MKRIDKIERLYHGGMFMYRVELCSNFYFDFSGCQVTYVPTVGDVYKCTSHIAFCNGK